MDVFTFQSGGQVILGLGHLQGVFYILGIGYALALVVFLWELFTHNCRRPSPPRPLTVLSPTPKPPVLKLQLAYN